MGNYIVLISGAVSSGKTTLAKNLASHYEFNIFSTKDYLQELRPSIPTERGALQDLGERLDRKTRGRWVCEGLSKAHGQLGFESGMVVDSIRIQSQIDHIRQAYGSGRVFHVHLKANTEELEKRYKKRKRSGFAELPSYADLSKNKTEARINRLEKTADVVMQTDRCKIEDIVVRTASHLGLYGKGCDRLVDVVIGAQYGSEGKGNIAAYLAKEYDVLVRVGGPNAGHKVYGEPPYTFHQLPSGTRRAEVAKLIVGPGAVINVDTIREEIAEYSVSKDRLSIDPQAIVIEESDIQKDSMLVETIGSTGQGVGSATSRRISERKGSPRFSKDIPDLGPFIRETVRELEKTFARGQKVLVEGTQGTGLSLYHGPYPYVTSRDTTVAGCLAETGISPSRVRKVLMVCRSYPIRVQSPKGKGNSSGPLSEITFGELSRRSDIPLHEIEKTETTSTTHKKRRIGEFDWALLRTATSLNSPTDIALTFADYINAKNKGARRFEQLTKETLRFIEEVERVTCAPVSLISTRFDWRNIIDRRVW